MSCLFQIHTPLNSFTPDSLHRVFSDYNPFLIRIPICVDPCRKDLCSGDHLYLCKWHHLPSPPYVLLFYLLLVKGETTESAKSLKNLRERASPRRARGGRRRIWFTNSTAKDASSASGDSPAGGMPSDDLDGIGDRGGYWLRENDSSQRLQRFGFTRTGASTSVREVSGGRRISSDLPAAVVRPRHRPRGEGDVSSYSS